MKIQGKGSVVTVASAVIIASVLFAAAITCITPCEAQTKGIRAVWACNDGEKIERDDTDNPNKMSNSAWDGEKVRIFGARNEILAFQLIVETGEQSIDELNVSLPGLVHRGGTAAIRYTPLDRDPTLYVGRPIQIFTVNYMNVSQRTKATWFYPVHDRHPAVPKDPTGWKPVQLVPENAKPDRGGFPLTVKRNRNQAIWIEIYTAKDLPAGMYDGSITVSADGETREVPVELEIFDFTLPDANSMHAMLYYESGQPDRYHGTGGTNSLDPAYQRIAHRNRVEFVTTYNETKAAEKIDLFTGEAFTRDRGYEGPGEGVGNTIIPRTFYGPGRDFETKEDAWSHADSWMTWLNGNLPGKITFIYMPDEPGRDKYPVIHEYAERIHGNPGPGGKLPVLVTAGYKPGLDGTKQAIDIWCSFYGQYSIPLAEIERSHGDDMWIYNGQRPYGGALLIDTPAVDPRANIWSCFKHGIKVYFYWHTCHWRHNNHLPDGMERNQDVWAKPVTFMNKNREFANGDGCLLYPGEEVLHPRQDRGVPGPCSTVTMANLRRGLQDHIYLTMARDLGREDEVKAALQTIVPKVLSDVGRNDGVSFPEDGTTFDEVRYRLGKTIENAKKK